jgi:hypothetical protein
MAKKTNTKKTAPRQDKTRMRMEIVEAVRGLHKIGAVSETEVTKTTLRMLGKDALPKVERMSPSQIVAVRGKNGCESGDHGRVSQRGGEHDQPVGARRAASDGRRVEAPACRESKWNRGASITPRSAVIR